MALIAKGSKSSLVWKEETALGTAPAGNWTAFSLTNETIVRNIKEIVSSEIQSSRQVPLVRGGNIAAGGNISVELGCRRFATWFEHLLAGEFTDAAVVPTVLAVNLDVVIGELLTNNGRIWIVEASGNTGAAALTQAVAAAGSGDVIVGTALMRNVAADTAAYYMHTLNAGADFPAVGLAFEKQIKGQAAPMYEAYLGCRVNSLKLNVPQDGLVKADWTIEAMNLLAPSAVSVAGVPVHAVEEAFTGYETSVELNLGAGWVQMGDLKQATLNITNNVSTSEYRMGSRQRLDLPEGMRDCSGTLDMYFVDMNDYNRFANENTFGVRFAFIHLGQMFRITMPWVRYNGSPTPSISGSGAITASFAFHAFNPTGAGSDVFAEIQDTGLTAETAVV